MTKEPTAAQSVVSIVDDDASLRGVLRSLLIAVGAQLSEYPAARNHSPLSRKA